MTGLYCAVASCKNSKQKNPNLSFHRFPCKDKKLFKKWLTKCKLKDDFKVAQSYARVCSEHFGPEMFQEDMMAKLMNTPRRRVLLKGSIPKYKLLGIDDTPRETSRSQRMKLKEEQEKHNAIIREVLSNSSEQTKSTMEPVALENELHKSTNEQLVYQNVLVHKNVIFFKKNSEPFSQERPIEKPFCEPLFHKNVLIDERRIRSRKNDDRVAD